MAHYREDNVLLIIPFSSSRKRATTVKTHPSNSDKVRIYCKGAPEIVIPLSSSIIGQGGSIESLTED